MLLTALSPLEHDRLALWFLTKKLDEVAKQCARPAPEGFGLTFSSDALIAWEHAECGDSLVSRQRRAHEMQALIPSNDGTRDPMDAVILHALKLRLFELSVRPQSDVNEIKTLFLLMMEARNHQLAERKLQMSLDEIATALSEKAKYLNPEEMQKFARSLLGEFEDPNGRISVAAPIPLNPQSIPA